MKTYVAVKLGSQIVEMALVTILSQHPCCWRQATQPQDLGQRKSEGMPLTERALHTEDTSQTLMQPKALVWFGWDKEQEGKNVVCDKTVDLTC